MPMSQSQSIIDIYRFAYHNYSLLFCIYAASFISDKKQQGFKDFLSQCIYFLELSYQSKIISETIHLYFSTQYFQICFWEFIVEVLYVLRTDCNLFMLTIFCRVKKILRAVTLTFILLFFQNKTNIAFFFIVS